MYFIITKIAQKNHCPGTMIDNLTILEKRAPSAPKFHALKAMPPELEWDANIRSEKTR